MSVQFFSFHPSDKTRLFLPNAYRRSVPWVPRIGDIFPNFEADTTVGRLRFFDWAEGGWTYVFSHPAARTPICTTELVALAAAKRDFARRNIKLLGLSGSTLEDQHDWHADILRLFGVQVDVPFVADTSGKMARAFGMIHDKEATDWPIRKSFIIDPLFRVRMIFEYPVHVGRSTDEILRVIDAARANDRTGLAVPADWIPGDDLVYAEDRTDAEMVAQYGKHFVRLTDYLGVVRSSFWKSREQAGRGAPGFAVGDTLNGSG